MISLRKRVTEISSGMLNPNANSQPDWKFLIYDSIGRDILQPIFTDDLKRLYVTMRLNIQSEREVIPDPVSAIYFVMPTDENIELICKDLKSCLYDSYYFNFISPVPQSKLQAIADSALLSNTASSIKKIYDQYLNFIALEDNFLILRESDKKQVSFYAINRKDADEEEINIVIDNIVDCLFSLLVILKTIPIIRCPKGGPAAMVSERLCDKISDALKDNRNNLFNRKLSNSPGSSFQKPLLCLVDRTIDMSTPLHHTWTYQALIHDLLKTELNKVEVNEDDNPADICGKPKPKLYDLDPSDKFWSEHRGSPFPQVAEAAQKGLDEYKKREDELSNLKSKIGYDGPGDDLSLLADSAAKLTNAAKSLPEMSETRRELRKHTNVASAVLDEIKARKLDNYFEIEEKIMNRSLIDKAILDDMLNDSDYGQPNDKYRLFLIAYICDNPKLVDDEAEKYVDILEGLGCKRSAFEFVKQWKTLSKTNVASLQSSLQSSSGVLKTASMFSKLMSQSSQFVMEGVKNLVLKEHHLPLTKIVDGLMDCSSKKSRESISYSYYDPTSPSGEVDLSARKKVFKDAILFVVGGGNYIEYQNLVDYADSKSHSSYGPASKTNLIYGSTNLMNANEFIEQLAQLGE